MAVARVPFQSGSGVLFQMAGDRLPCEVGSSLSAMGLLDEAIREHLDLKRRRGADPAEVERAAREALSPARRQPESLVARGFVAQALDGPPPSLYDQHASDAWYGNSYEDDDRGEEAPRSDAVGNRLGALASGPPPMEPEDLVGQETVEYSVEEEIEDESRADMLQATPEFLHDAPDHDRLWFEQRRARDFNFDG